jgi:two-component system KDP operon response regulator KdpE
MTRAYDLVSADVHGSPTGDVLRGCATILVVDDETQIRRGLRNLLGDHGVRVVEAATGRDALDAAAFELPDLVVLDVGLPDMVGDVVCRELRAWSAVPVLVLSARHSEHEKIKLLDAGADDYLTKPFSPGELLARIRALVRRTGSAATTQAEAVQVGDVVIDVARRRVSRGGTAVHLTPIEWDLLRTLVTHAGRTLTHRQIFDAVWRRPHGNAQQYLRVHLTHLRRKIERDPSEPSMIITEPGVGYRFDPTDQAPG